MYCSSMRAAPQRRGAEIHLLWPCSKDAFRVSDVDKSSFYTANIRYTDRNIHKCEILSLIIASPPDLILL